MEFSPFIALEGYMRQFAYTGTHVFLATRGYIQVWCNVIGGQLIKQVANYEEGGQLTKQVANLQRRPPTYEAVGELMKQAVNL
jgi:hypothetical protein